jgi:hypothetical protein
MRCGILLANLATIAPRKKTNNHQRLLETLCTDNADAAESAVRDNICGGRERFPLVAGKQQTRAVTTSESRLKQSMFRIVQEGCRPIPKRRKK